MEYSWLNDGKYGFGFNLSQDSIKKDGNFTATITVAFKNSADLFDGSFKPRIYLHLADGITVAKSKSASIQRLPTGTTEDITKNLNSKWNGGATFHDDIQWNTLDTHGEVMLLELTAAGIFTDPYNREIPLCKLTASVELQGANQTYNPITKKITATLTVDQGEDQFSEDDPISLTESVTIATQKLHEPAIVDFLISQDKDNKVHLSGTVDSWTDKYILSFLDSNKAVIPGLDKFHVDDKGTRVVEVINPNIKDNDYSKIVYVRITDDRGVTSDTPVDFDLSLLDVALTTINGIAVAGKPEIYLFPTQKVTLALTTTPRISGLKLPPMRIDLEYSSGKDELTVGKATDVVLTIPSDVALRNQALTLAGTVGGVYKEATIGAGFDIAGLDQPNVMVVDFPIQVAMQYATVTGRVDTTVFHYQLSLTNDAILPEKRKVANIFYLKDNKGLTLGTNDTSSSLEANYSFSDNVDLKNFAAEIDSAKKSNTEISVNVLSIWEALAEAKQWDTAPKKIDGATNVFKSYLSYAAASHLVYYPPGNSCTWIITDRDVVGLGRIVMSADKTDLTVKGTVSFETVPRVAPTGNFHWCGPDEKSDFTSPLKLTPTVDKKKYTLSASIGMAQITRPLAPTVLDIAIGDDRYPHPVIIRMPESLFIVDAKPTSFEVDANKQAKVALTVTTKVPLYGLELTATPPQGSKLTVALDADTLKLNQDKKISAFILEENPAKADANFCQILPAGSGMDDYLEAKTTFGIAATIDVSDVDLGGMAKFAVYPFRNGNVSAQRVFENSPSQLAALRVAKKIIP